MEKYDAEITIRFRVKFVSTDKETIKKYTTGLGDEIAQHINDSDTIDKADVFGYSIEKVRAVNERIIRREEEGESAY